MIRLKPELAQGLDDPQKLRAALQTAIELEHATLPTYLYALYSLEPGHNREIAALLRSIVMDEMSHMGLACNLLNAIGGAPVIDSATFVPKYPGPLPGSVESDLEVPLSPFTQDLVENVFMVIEEPEDPLKFRTLELAEEQLTIGQFYTAIADQLQAAGPDIFISEPGRQVDGFLDVVAITNLDGALKAIELIVEQGEGTTQSPNDDAGQLAHYYRFAEINKGNTLIKNPDAPPDAPPDERFIYAGAKIPFEPAGVRPVVLNPTSATYADFPTALTANNTFNSDYTKLLKSLHLAFNGTPDALLDALDSMDACKAGAISMGTIAVGDGKVAGPSFEFQPTDL